MVHPLRNLARASLIGLTGGLVVSAFALAFAAFANLNHDCQFPETLECTFEVENAAHIARLQAYSALGCALVGAGLILFLRRGK
jgi:hypothetical protein